MRNIYYLIWADSIQSIRKFQPNNKNWKFKTFFFITSMNSFNLWTIMLWLKYLNILTLYHVNIEFFPGHMLNNFVSFMINFASPFILINYFVIIRNNRYEKILERYKNLKIRYGFIYMVSSIIISFLSAILYGILTHTIWRG